MQEEAEDILVSSKRKRPCTSIIYHVAELTLFLKYTGIKSVESKQLDPDALMPSKQVVTSRETGGKIKNTKYTANGFLNDWYHTNP